MQVLLREVDGLREITQVQHLEVGLLVSYD